MQSKHETILNVKDLKVTFSILRGEIRAVRGISFELKRGEILGIVGESGCGKSTASMALMSLLPRHARIEADSINVAGNEMIGADKTALQHARGNLIAYVFQDPQASLNPVMKIGDQIVEAIHVKNPDMPKDEMWERAGFLLNDVKINNPSQWLNAYPHQLSGGMKQRVMIAMALANDPAILVADEPTTSLDVTIQSEILLLIKELNSKHDMSVIFITHDLAVAEKLCSRIAVMYAGKIVEINSADEIINSPMHPYTMKLWKSIPRIDDKIDSLAVIPGHIPDKLNLPKGCAFHPRCEYARDDCRENIPALKKRNTGFVACLHPLDGGH